jgi:hypothetical protein
MTTSTETTFVVTACPAHGTRECSDLASLRVYVEAAFSCDFGYVWVNGTCTTTDAHDAYHAREGHDCWRCCADMVIDPEGVLDF